MVAGHLGKPLTRIPDPFGKYESFGHHNNARLRGFLDTFGFEYEFQSATDWYTSGRFDDALLQVLRHYDEVKNVVLPTLGPERSETYRSEEHTSELQSLMRISYAVFCLKKKKKTKKIHKNTHNQNNHIK